MNAHCFHQFKDLAEINQMWIFLKCDKKQHSSKWGMQRAQNETQHEKMDKTLKQKNKQAPNQAVLQYIV